MARFPSPFVSRILPSSDILTFPSSSPKGPLFVAEKPPRFESWVLRRRQEPLRLRQTRPRAPNLRGRLRHLPRYGRRVRTTMFPISEKKSSPFPRRSQTRLQQQPSLTWRQKMHLSVCSPLTHEELSSPFPAHLSEYEPSGRRGRSTGASPFSRYVLGQGPTCFLVTDPLSLPRRTPGKAPPRLERESPPPYPG